jgi:hypothetical protein
MIRIYHISDSLSCSRKTQHVSALILRML